MANQLEPTLRAAERLRDSPTLRAAELAVKQLSDSPMMRAAEQLRDSPTMRAAELAAKQLTDSPMMRAAEQLGDSPTMRAAELAAEQLRDSPMMRAVEQLRDSPTMRAAELAVEQLRDSPMMRAVEQLRDSPTMRAAELAAKQLRDSPMMRAVEQLRDSPTMRAAELAAKQLRDSPMMRAVEQLAAMPPLTSELFGTAWNEGLEAAVKRLERAEDLIAEAPEPELAVEALATDTDTVREAAPPEAREGINKWAQWFWIYLVQKLVLDPALEQTMEAGRDALPALLIVLSGMVTDPTLPTPPPAPALWQQEALAPMSAPPKALVLPGGWQIEGLPDIVLRAGPQAVERTIEFFTAQIRNPHTRAAYGAAVTRFFAWCDARGLELAQISPIAVATYIEEMQSEYRAPTIKQHLAAIRRLFDFLVIGRVVPANPAASVRGPTHVVKTGKTPVLQPAEARLLLDSIDTSTLPGLRDRALLGVMIYSFARVSAVVSMRVEDYYQQQGKRRWLRLQKRAGKHHAVPVHHKAEAYLDAYLDAAGIAAEKSTPLWRSMPRAGGLGARRMSRVDVFRMIKRRVKAVGLGEANCHTFRATGITAYLLNGGTLERAQRIAAHESPRTTKLYDRTAAEVTVEDIEKIGI